MNPGIRILPLLSGNGLFGGGWAGRGQSNLFPLGGETFVEGGWTTSWSTALLCAKETGILPHYYFPWKDSKSYIKKEEDKWTPKWWNTSTAFSGPANKQYTCLSIREEKNIINNNKKKNFIKIVFSTDGKQMLEEQWSPYKNDWAVNARCKNIKEQNIK